MVDLTPIARNQTSLAGVGATTSTLPILNNTYKYKSILLFFSTSSCKREKSYWRRGL